MQPHRPHAALTTHDVSNMPPYIGDQDLWLHDIAFREAIHREGASNAREKIKDFALVVGRQETFESAALANKCIPELRTFDRYGMRVDDIVFHPAYHDLMRLAIENEVGSYAWRNPGVGAHVGHMALTYLLSQAEGGVLCPMAMTYSAIPALNATSQIAGEWIDRITSLEYDSRDIPVEQKHGATMGMFLTEKQGGSDVRANTTHARAIGADSGEGMPYLLSGHKFFCSAPMCDAFLTIAHTDDGIGCFLVPRWRPDGARNNLFIQKLKPKLGNHSNATTEIELQDTWGVMLGEPGRGLSIILQMVQGNRIYCATSSAAMMRQALVQALHHCGHRTAFGRSLIDQPLMQNVLADLAIETEAAMALVFRVARAMDESAGSEEARVLARIGTSIAKYWICKRAPVQILEALECHGGSGYIEESIMPRLYREAPVNSIWEGSGNVICLDVLRALAREPQAADVILAELKPCVGIDPDFDRAVTRLSEALVEHANWEARARSITELMARALQASLLLKHASPDVARAFCATRLGAEWSGVEALDNCQALQISTASFIARGAKPSTGRERCAVSRSSDLSMLRGVIRHPGHDSRVLETRALLVCDVGSHPVFPAHVGPSPLVKSDATVRLTTWYRSRSRRRTRCRGR